jgi:hypothetical protein
MSVFDSVRSLLISISGTGVSVVWDSMMTGLGCCGVNNYTDFAGLLQNEQVVSISHLSFWVSFWRKIRQQIIDEQSNQIN